MKIGTLTTGAASVDVFKLNYVPQYLYFIAATQITSILVTVAGDGVIMNLTGDGISAVSGIRRYGAVVNSYYIPLADGFIPDKVCEISTVNSAAQTPALYGHSLQRGDSYITSQMQTVLSGSGQVFENFSHIAILSMATTDLLTVGFVDGQVQDFESTELLAWYTLYSNEVDSYCIDNVAGMIDYVKLIPSADRVVVVNRAVEIGEIAGYA